MIALENKDIHILLNMFIMYFQAQEIGLFRYPVGEKPTQLSSDEALNLTKDFMVEYNRQY